MTSPSLATRPVDVFEALERHLQQAHSNENIGDHFAVRHVASCPRYIWFNAHQVPYSNPPGLAQRIVMRWGQEAEDAEFLLISEMDPALLGNTRPIADVIASGKFPALTEAFQAAGTMWQARSMLVFPNILRGLPIRTTFPGVARRLHGVVDYIMLVGDSPRIVEVKQTRGRSAANIRLGGGPWTSWVLQLYIYCRALDLPGELHVWGRENGYYTRFPLVIEGEDVLLEGRLYMIGALGKAFTPAEYVAARFAYLEEILRAPEPPGRARLIGGRIIEPVFPGCPMPGDETYRLTITKSGRVGEDVSVQGVRYTSRRCGYCWHRDNCMGRLIGEILKKLAPEAAPPSPPLPTNLDVTEEAPPEHPEEIVVAEGGEE